MTLLTRAIWPTLFAGLGVFCVLVFTGKGGDVSGIAVYTALMIASAAACFARSAQLPAERIPWIVMGAGLVLFAVGDLYWSVALADLDEPPYPSLADIGWIVWYPLAATALIMIVRQRFPRSGRAQWLDGAVAGLGCAAVSVGLFAGGLVASSIGDSFGATATNLAYPLGDLVLMAICICGLAISGWRPGWSYLLICGGVLVGTVADFSYLWTLLDGSYAEGDAIDILWPASTLLIAFAAFQPATHLPPYTGRRVLAISAVVSLGAVALLVSAHYTDLHPLAVWLAAATLVAVVARTWLTFGDYVKLLERTTRDAATDALTGLGNRRALIAGLDALLADTDGDPHALVLLDLNGFKGYNDTLGHAAGDDLLTRIARRLDDGAGGAGRAYRMGGDEFCVIAPAEPHEVGPLLDELTRAAGESKDGLVVTAAAGVVVLPGEASTPDAALGLADSRMYRDKQEARDGGGRYALA